MERWVRVKAERREPLNSFVWVWRASVTWLHPPLPLAPSPPLSLPRHLSGEAQRGDVALNLAIVDHHHPNLDARRHLHKQSPTRLRPPPRARAISPGHLRKYSSASVNETLGGRRRRGNHRHAIGEDACFRSFFGNIAANKASKQVQLTSVSGRTSQPSPKHRWVTPPAFHATACIDTDISMLAT